jgi:hypothetical protein
MSPLADFLYAILRDRASTPRPELTYTELCIHLVAPFLDLQPNSRRLWNALSEIGHACRHHGLPYLSAIVVSANTGVPGGAYFADAHPAEAHDRVLSTIAWAQEVLRVRQTTHPRRLESPPPPSAP